MLAGMLQLFAGFFIVGLPAFILPLIIGPIILFTYRKDQLSGIAGALTLKPLLATPILGVTTYMGLRQAVDPWLLSTLLPGIVLTLLIVLAFRHSLKTDPDIVGVLLVADAIRWLNTHAMLASGDSFWSPLFLVALVLPSLYALMALGILQRRAKQRTQQITQPAL